MADWQPSNEPYLWWRLLVRIGIWLGLAIVAGAVIWALVSG
jgi:hypothetical protein